MPAAFDPPPFSCGVDQHLPNDFRRGGEEVGAVGPRDRGRPEQPEIGLVDDLGRIELPRVLVTQLPLGDLPQPVVDRRRQIIRGDAFPAGKARKQFGNRLGHV